MGRCVATIGRTRHQCWNPFIMKGNRKPNNIAERGDDIYIGDMGSLVRDLWLERDPYITHDESSRCRFVQLRDGSIVSCSTDSMKLWSIVTKCDEKGDKRPRLQLVGTFNNFVACVRVAVVERDEDGAIVVLGNDVLKVWNTTTFECIETVSLTKRVWSMVKTKNNKSLVCGRKDGWIEIRRMKELGEIVSLFNVHGDPSANLNNQLNRPLVMCICELTDGTFVS